MKPHILTVLLAPPGSASDATAWDIVNHNMRIRPGPPSDLISGRPINRYVRNLNVATVKMIVGTPIDKLVETEQRSAADNLPGFAHTAACILRTFNEPEGYRERAQARPGLLYDPIITDLWPLWEMALDYYLKNYTFDDELKTVSKSYNLIRADQQPAFGLFQPSAGEDVNYGL